MLGIRSLWQTWNSSALANEAEGEQKRYESFFWRDSWEVSGTAFAGSPHFNRSGERRNSSRIKATTKQAPKILKINRGSWDKVIRMLDCESYIKTSVLRSFISGEHCCKQHNGHQNPQSVKSSYDIRDIMPPQSSQPFRTETQISIQKNSNLLIPLISSRTDLNTPHAQLLTPALARPNTTLKSTFILPSPVTTTM